MAEGCVTRVRLRFKVIDEKSGRKFMILYDDHPTFEQKCKQKFGYAPDEDVVFVLEDDQDVELDESVIETCDDKTTFRMRQIFVDSEHRRNAEDKNAVYVSTTSEDKNERTDNTKNDNDVSEHNRSVEDTNAIDASTISGDKTENTKNTESDNVDSEHKRTVEDTSDECDNRRNMENSSDEDWNSPENEKLTSGVDYIRKEMKKRGKGMLEAILREAEKLSLAPLNICVTGGSGEGKSKLINTLRNLKPGDGGYAAVGFIETTDKCTGYHHPYHPNIVFWDVPGVGTIDFPRKAYLKTIEFRKYDFFLICSSTRFTEDDAWLAHDIRKQKKRFYFLRTKVDHDIENAYKELQENFDENVALDKIKQNCIKNLKRHGHDDVPVFLISSFKKTEYDFPSLFKKLIEDAPAEQRRSLTYGLVSVSDEMIESKAKYLQADIWKTALLSAMGGAVPIPGISNCIDLALIVNRVVEFRRELELRSSDLEDYAKMVSLPEKDFIKAVGLKIDYVLLSIESGKVIMSTFTLGSLVEETSRYVPVIGTTVALGLSYWVTGKVLNQFLNDMVNDAKKIHAFVAKKQANKK